MMIICLQIFFNELGIPKPHLNLKVGSSSHGLQTSVMVPKIEKSFIRK